MKKNSSVFANVDRDNYASVSYGILLVRYFYWLPIVELAMASQSISEPRSVGSFNLFDLARENHIKDETFPSA